MESFGTDMDVDAILRKLEKKTAPQAKRFNVTRIVLRVLLNTGMSASLRVLVMRLGACRIATESCISGVY